MQSFNAFDTSTRHGPQFLSLQGSVLVEVSLEILGTQFHDEGAVALVQNVTFDVVRGFHVLVRFDEEFVTDDLKVLNLAGEGIRVVRHFDGHGVAGGLSRLVAFPVPRVNGALTRTRVLFRREQVAFAEFLFARDVIILLLWLAGEGPGGKCVVVNATLGNPRLCRQDSQQQTRQR